MQNLLRFNAKTAAQIEQELTELYGQSKREYILEFRVFYSLQLRKAYLLKVLQNQTDPPTLNYLFGEVDEQSFQLCPDFHILDYPLRKHYDLDFLDQRWTAFIRKDE